jgi:hypothetical protein
MGKEQKQRQEHREFIEEERDYKKKFLEELIPYFRLILHGPHRKPKNWGGGTETAR